LFPRPTPVVPRLPIASVDAAAAAGARGASSVCHTRRAGSR